MSVLLKVLYLVTGLSLKEMVDAANAQRMRRIEILERRHESYGTYRPNPALEKGSAAAHRAIMEQQHAANVAPIRRKLRRQIGALHWLPFVFWLLVFCGSVGLTVYLELNPRVEQEQSHAVPRGTQAADGDPGR